MEVSLSDDELKQALIEQLEFLEASATSFDGGYKGEAKRLAVTVRVLVHDTNKSTSLLHLLGTKASTQFVDTSLPVIEENRLTHSSLVKQVISPSGVVIAAVLDEAPHPTRSIGFDAWWNGIVFVDKHRNEFSRKDVVLTLANKEGGAHVDAALDAKWVALRKSNSLNWVSISSDGKQVPGEDQVPATMRQIAHELLKTLKGGYVCMPPEIPGAMLHVMGASLVEGARPPAVHTHNLPKNRPMVSGRRVGRNDQCPCGSGKKYKRCCIA